MSKTTISHSEAGYLVTPKFRLGQTVFLLIGSTVYKGTIQSIDFQGADIARVGDPPLYKAGRRFVASCYGLSGDVSNIKEEQLFTSLDELLSHLRGNVAHL